VCYNLKGKSIVVSCFSRSVDAG